MIGEVRTIGGRRSSDVNDPTPTPEMEAAAVAADAGERNAIEAFDADRPASADRDAQGNWVPPILRGMAPDAREKKDALPHRRRKDEE